MAECDSGPRGFREDAFCPRCSSNLYNTESGCWCCECQCDIEPVKHIQPTLE